MPKRTPDAYTYELAKRGAEAQLRDLLREAQLLLGLFPHLRDSFDKDELPLEFIMAKASGRLTKKTGRRARQMSARSRKTASSRMKK